MMIAREKISNIVESERTSRYFGHIFSHLITSSKMEKKKKNVLVASSGNVN